MDDRIDHSVQVIRTGDAEVVDVVYTYGVLGPRPIKRLGWGGGGVTAPMPIPDDVDVRWTTEADGQKHEAHVPLKSKVSAAQVQGNIISIEIEGAVLRVFLVKRLPDHRQERAQQLF